MQECVHVTGSRPFRLAFNSSSLTTHTCHCLKCCEAERLVNQSVTESTKKPQSSVFEGKPGQSRLPLYFPPCQASGAFPVNTTAPHLYLLSLFSSPRSPIISIHPGGLRLCPHHTSKSWATTMGQCASMQRHWCHIESIQIHPSWN